MQISMQHLKRSILGGCLLAVLLIAGCATSDSGFDTGTRSGAGRIQACRSGDQLIASARQCLQDGAACYEISNGKWCTGPRGNVCPAGSSEIPTGTACPRGARCINYGEGLSCAVQFN